jgi:hypothetical protein
MHSQIEDADAALVNVTSVEEAQRAWAQRIAAREQLVATMSALEPPESAAELHEAARDILGRLTEAEAAMGLLATEYDSMSELAQIWGTPEGLAARAVDQDAIAICQAAQARFDETTDREVLEDVSWVTAEMKDIIDVVFGCTAEERGS